MKFKNPAHIICTILHIPCNMKGYIFHMSQMPCKIRGSLSTMQLQQLQLQQEYQDKQEPTTIQQTTTNNQQQFSNSMPNGRFPLQNVENKCKYHAKWKVPAPNAANGLQNGRFQLQNAENSLENGFRQRSKNNP